MLVLCVPFMKMNINLLNSCGVELQGLTLATEKLMLNYLVGMSLENFMSQCAIQIVSIPISPPHDS